MAGLPNTISPDRMVRGRLAPSPTGLLHLGNAWAFLLAWVLCRQAGGRLVLRMEDLDPARSRPEYAAAAIADLRWLGLDWDEGPDTAPSAPDPQGLCGPYAPYTQSLRSAHYAAALDRLAALGRTYPCYCTRKELRTLAGAPHVGDEGAPYPGLCRHLSATARLAHEQNGRKPAVRLDCRDDIIHFTDRVYGQQAQGLAACGGDFALRRSDGVIAYQLAVVVDDGLMRINQVVRGRDILPSTCRQLALFDALGMPRPEYAHVPLLCDAQGERLAKRHQSLSLAALREAGVSPRAVVGYLAGQGGLVARPGSLDARELLAMRLTVPDWWRERDIILDADPVAALLRLTRLAGLAPA